MMRVHWIRRAAPGSDSVTRFQDHIMTAGTILFVAFAGVAASGSLLAQASAQASTVAPFQPVVVARANSSSLTIDGTVDDAVWRAVPSTFTFTQTEPSVGAPATQATDVRVILTRDAVLIRARLAGEPSRRGGKSGDRPAMLDVFGEDYFQVKIDPHRDHLTAVALMISSSGIKRSWLVARDGSVDDSWNVQWEASTHTGKGEWTAEIRVPLSELHSRRGSENWGIQFERFSYARQETDVTGSTSGRSVTDREH
jgi:hypothetical protein